MKKKIIVNGAQGKMGQITCQTIMQHPEYELVAKCDRHDDLAQAITSHQADIVIDFTLPECAYQNCQTILQCHAHPIIGTSGLNPQQRSQLKQIAKDKKLGGLIVPNFSISALCMMHAASLAARYFQSCEILEYHHPQKVDSPSGTAIKTAELINESRKFPKPIHSSDSARGHSNTGIAIHSLRLPSAFASQEVVFANNQEEYRLTQHCHSRQAMMPGVILACQKVMELNTLLYGLETLLFSNQANTNPHHAI